MDLCRAILAREHSFPVTSMMLFSPRRFLATATFSTTPLFLESSSTHTKDASGDSNDVYIFIFIIFISQESLMQARRTAADYVVIPGSLSAVYKKCVRRSE